MHAAKLFKHKISAKGEIDTDDAYKTAENRFLAHYQQSFALLDSLEEFAEVTKKLSIITGDFGNRMSAYYHLVSPERPPRVADFIGTAGSAAGSKLGAIAEVDWEKNVRVWSEYCGFLRSLNAKIGERKVALENYDYYRNKVRELKEKPRDDGQLARNEGKLFATRDTYESVNTELVEVFNSLTDNAAISFNPRFAALARLNDQTLGALTNFNADLQNVVQSAASYGVADVDVIYKPLQDKYGILPAHEERKASLLTSWKGFNTKGPSTDDQIRDKPVTSRDRGGSFKNTSSSSTGGGFSSTPSAPVSSPSATRHTSSSAQQNYPSQALEDFSDDKTLRAGRRARALFDFDAQAADELRLQQGDVVVLVAEAESGWWKAELNGMRGVVPFNYLEGI
jgi:hypothetical protein